jgi:hypothetical protein
MAADGDGDTGAKQMVLPNRHAALAAMARSILTEIESLCLVQNNADCLPPLLRMPHLLGIAVSKRTMSSSRHRQFFNCRDAAASCPTPL